MTMTAGVPHPAGEELHGAGAGGVPDRVRDLVHDEAEAARDRGRCARLQVRLSIIWTPKILPSLKISKLDLSLPTVLVFACICLFFLVFVCLLSLFMPNGLKHVPLTSSD